MEENFAVGGGVCHPCQTTYDAAALVSATESDTSVGIIPKLSTDKLSSVVKGSELLLYAQGIDFHTYISQLLSFHRECPSSWGHTRCRIWNRSVTGKGRSKCYKVGRSQKSGAKAVSIISSELGLDAEFIRRYRHRLQSAGVG